jgi:hypothetical protein
VVGPVANYAAVNGASPLAAIIAGWGLDIPVVDVAIKARAIANRQGLTFPNDGHLTESGHAYLAGEAGRALQGLLAADGLSTTALRVEQRDVRR